MAEVRAETLNHPVPQPWGDTLSRRRIGFVIAAVMLGMLLSALDQTVVGTAMPRIIASLNGLQHYAWVATGYLLASTASMPIWGKLSDAYGRKRFFIVGMAIFITGSVLCGQSHSMTELILFRAFQGLGAGAMMPISQAIIGDIFPPAQRAKWTGVLMSVWGVATIIGPLIGGWITDSSLGWRWTFYVNVPVGILALTFAAFALPAHVSLRKHRIDYIGSTLLVAAAVPLLLGLSWGGNTYAWTSPEIIGMFAFSLVMWVDVLPAGDARRGAGDQSAALPEQHLHRLGGGLGAHVGGDVRRHHVPAALRPGRARQVGHQLRHHPHAADDGGDRHQHRRRADPRQDRQVQGHRHRRLDPVGVRRLPAVAHGHRHVRDDAGPQHGRSWASASASP